ncbi:hypothetical protein T439DRAFT_341526 [Meredithblackwellia eburnea MCA 4105]
MVSVKPTSLGNAKVTQKQVLQSTDSKWVGLSKLTWQDQDGKERLWEVAGRKTTAAGGVDAVAIAAILNRSGHPLSVPIILQYRPPIEAICVELPAGLIDKSETAETAALRELHEETGYGGPEFEGRIKVVMTGGVIPSDPGMSTANMQLCTLEVDLKADEQDPVPNLDEGEHIEVRVTPLAELYDHLTEYEKLGYQVDARLHHFAAGIALAKKFQL